MLIVTNVRNTFDNEQSQLLKIVKKRKLPPPQGSDVTYRLQKKEALPLPLKNISRWPYHTSFFHQSESPPKPSGIPPKPRPP